MKFLFLLPLALSGMIFAAAVGPASAAPETMSPIDEANTMNPTGDFNLESMSAKDRANLIQQLASGNVQRRDLGDAAAGLTEGELAAFGEDDDENELFAREVNANESDAESDREDTNGIDPSLLKYIVDGNWDNDEDISAQLAADDINTATVDAQRRDVKTAANQPKQLVYLPVVPKCMTNQASPSLNCRIMNARRCWCKDNGPDCKKKHAWLYAALFENRAKNAAVAFSATHNKGVSAEAYATPSAHGTTHKKPNKLPEYTTKHKAGKTTKKVTPPAYGATTTKHHLRKHPKITTRPRTTHKTSPLPAYGVTYTKKMSTHKAATPPAYGAESRTHTLKHTTVKPHASTTPMAAPPAYDATTSRTHRHHRSKAHTTSKLPTYTTHKSLPKTTHTSTPHLPVYGESTTAERHVETSKHPTHTTHKSTPELPVNGAATTTKKHDKTSKAPEHITLKHTLKTTHKDTPELSVYGEATTTHKAKAPVHTTHKSTFKTTHRSTSKLPVYGEATTTRESKTPVHITRKTTHKNTAKLPVYGAETTHKTKPKTTHKPVHTTKKSTHHKSVHHEHTVTHTTTHKTVAHATHYSTLPAYTTHAEPTNYKRGVNGLDEVESDNEASDFEDPNDESGLDEPSDDEAESGTKLSRRSRNPNSKVPIQPKCLDNHPTNTPTWCIGIHKRRVWCNAHHDECKTKHPWLYGALEFDPPRHADGGKAGSHNGKGKDRGKHAAGRVSGMSSAASASVLDATPMRHAALGGFSVDQAEQSIGPQ